MKKSAQKGVAHILLLIAALGVVAFILVSSSAEFKDKIFGQLFPKPSSEAATLTGNTFLETFDGGPAAPEPWDGADFDVTVHRRDAWSNPLRYVEMNGHHGAGCEPPLVDTNQPFNASTNPLVTHVVNSYETGVFNCRNHVMTSIWEEGYGLIYLTPNAMVDFSAGEAVIRWDMSTFRSSTRDWVDIWISPFEDHLQLALETGLPDLNGFPRRAIQFRMDNNGNGSFFRTAVICNFGGGCGGTGSTSDVAYETVLTPSPARRDTFEIRISRTHIRFCMPADPGDNMPSREICWADRTLPDLGWDRGIVQFGHHSYTPSKGSGSNSGLPGGRPDTWHWDNVSISPAVPFTIIKADRRWVNRTISPARVTFPTPAPANSFLRFAGISGTGPGMEVSFNQGATWVKARVQPASSRQGASGGEGDELFDSYFMPIPQGTTTVDFRGTTWFADGWMASDISIFSTNQPTGTPTPLPTLTPTSTPAPISTLAPTPTPTPTPRPTSTPTSTPTPASTSTPAPVSGTTQTITLNDLAIYKALSEYPRGIINWGNQWFVARPTNQFNTPNLHFSTSTGSSRSFGFVTPRRLIRLDMINHGTTSSTVTLTCGDQPRRAVIVNPRAILTGVQTNWTLPCSTVTINSSNGWQTHYDNLVIQ